MAGLEFFAVEAGPKRSRLLLNVPSDVEVEFIAAPPKFVFTILTYRSEAEPRVPLVRHEFVLTPRGTTRTDWFVLQGTPFSEQRFREHLREFGAPSTTSEQREHLLYVMRDEGVSQPDRALQLLGGLDHSQYGEGHLGEELSEVIGELEWARDIPHEGSRR